MSGVKCAAPCCAEVPHVSLQLEVGWNHLLSSNTVPSGAEIPLIRRNCVESQTRLDGLNCRIDALQATLDQLVEERAKLVEERAKLVDDIQRHIAVLAPIRRVPPEIVCEIFSWIPQSTRKIGVTLVDQPSWWLGHICSSWREIAVGESRLWRTFNILHSWGHPLQFTYPQSMLQTQLLRSASAPLAIILNWSSNEIVEMSADRLVLGTLLASSNRWESIRVHCYSATSRTILLDALRGLKGQLSQLKTLEFINEGDTSPPLDQSDIFSIAPRLTDILLTDSRTAQYSPNFLVPWRQITRYRGVYSLAQQLEIFQNSSNLVECGVSLDYQNEAQGDVLVTVPYLRRLFAESTVSLSHLTLPALAELFTQGPVDPILPFIHRSSCWLTALVLTSFFSSKGLIPVLETSPSLELLYLDEQLAEPPTTGALFTAMTASRTSSDILPNLTSFAYGTSSANNDASWHESLFPMIRSRLQPELSCRLSFVRLYGYNNAFREALWIGILALTDTCLDIESLDWHEGQLLVMKNRP
ncbi:hypothetical protein B0H11DRAFT_1250639 [Mycena galericulata]|nr:hypothetical protein B0H11DRAFT_1250639 [Mycena galericulata]